MAPGVLEQFALLDAVVAPFVPGDTPLWSYAEKGTSGPIAGLLSGPLPTWSGAADLDLPITWCDGSTTWPDGLWALYVRVQDNPSGTADAAWATTGIMWSPRLIAVGEAAWPYGNWPY